MAVCLECGFIERPEAGPCPKCGASHENAPTDIISSPQLLQSALAPGHLLARKYEIRSKLGGGGFGIVYLAHDIGLDKDVAVKILQIADPGGMDATEAKKRFLREARALARLDEHPNIVRVMNVDEDNGVPYFVMEHIAGGTLLDLLRQGPVPPERAASIAADVAAALTTVHASGVIHRDLKPANVFMKGERAMLGDFGIAYVPQESTLTVGSGMPGTPMYMSPESLLGKELDGRSDLFSLGCVLYEALTGAVLFKGDSVGQVVGRIIDPKEVDLSLVQEKAPAPLIAVLRRALAKRVADRYPSARFMERDLRVFVAGPGGAAVTGATPRLQADPTGLYAAVRAAAKGSPTQLSIGKDSAPAGDRRVFVLASVAVVLAGATLLISLRSKNNGVIESPSQAKSHPARKREAAGALPPSAAIDSPSSANSGDNASEPGIAPPASVVAPMPRPQPQHDAGIEIGVQIEGPVHTGAGAPASTGESATPNVSSSWQPTRLEDAISKGFRPPREGPFAGERASFLGPEMDPPELIERIEPEYPDNAREAGEEGKVILEIVVGRSGEVTNARVMKGHSLFDEAATTAVRLWKFRPARENGRPVNVLATVTLEFKLTSHS